ncbi:MAG: DUF979 domain-containing protein [Oscillospiraceae bacterium]|nr:DUF979 domain-containing protein [Oscillospiraceae bacterium]MBQ7816578.1 DUF979 domain-containing protein [Oscillospiraceae bacterium]
MAFFTNPDIALMTKLLEVVYIIIGIICIYTAVRNLFDKHNASPYGTAVFWGSVGVVIAFGRWLPNFFNGILILTMSASAVLRLVRPGEDLAPTPEQTKASFERIGMKIFVPALSIGLFSLIFALIGWNALVGTGFGVFIAIVLMFTFEKSNRPKVFFDDAARFLSIVGPTSMLPPLLAVLGSVFTLAGVGDVIASIVGRFIPADNVTVGVIVYALGMMIFTMIMGNAFAAITVMTVGIGAPFVLNYGADPVITVMLALTCGYCGTLLTPMAANFNIVPVAILDMKDKMGVIKVQILPALFMIVFQIIYMLLFI